MQLSPQGEASNPLAWGRWLRAYILPATLMLIIVLQQRQGAVTEASLVHKPTPGVPGGASKGGGQWANLRKNVQELKDSEDLGWLKGISSHERSVYSQNGEDGIIEYIFANIRTTNKYYVEFGTESGTQCNTRRLRDSGWSGLLMDGSNDNPQINLHKEIITPANINELFKKYQVPAEFDLLSIDVDYDDWWVWRSISDQYRPRVVITEYNAGIPLEKRWVVDPEDPARWLQTNYYGASARAFFDLGRRKGYTLVDADAAGVNLFFVRTDILRAQGLAAPSLLDVYESRLYHAPNLDTNRKWLVLDEGGAVVDRVYKDLSNPFAQS